MRSQALRFVLAMALVGTAAPARSAVLIIGDEGPPGVGPQCVGGSRNGQSCLPPCNYGAVPSEECRFTPLGHCPDGGTCTMPSGPPNPPADWLDHPPPGTLYVEDPQKGQVFTVPARTDGHCPGTSFLQLPGSSVGDFDADVESNANADEGGFCHYTVKKWKVRPFPNPANLPHE